MAPTEEIEGLRGTLHSAFGVAATSLGRIAAGTATSNYVVTDDSGRRWFAKVYPPSQLTDELQAIQLAIFARSGGLPVPAVHRALDGQLIAAGSSGTGISLWDYVEDAATAEGGLLGNSWATVGEAVGRLHRTLALHPAAAPATRPADQLYDPALARDRCDSLINDYRQRGQHDEFESWALAAAEQRRALLPRVLVGKAMYDNAIEGQTSVLGSGLGQGRPSELHHVGAGTAPVNGGYTLRLRDGKYVDKWDEKDPKGTWVRNNDYYDQMLFASELFFLIKTAVA